MEKSYSTSSMRHVSSSTSSYSVNGRGLTNSL